MTFARRNRLSSLTIGGTRTMTFVQEFAVSCLSASLAHIPHHPLYTLKSQMMYYGRDFSLLSFMRHTKNTKGTFLFQGTYANDNGMCVLATEPSGGTYIYVRILPRFSVLCAQVWSLERLASHQKRPSRCRPGYWWVAGSTGT